MNLATAIKKSSGLASLAKSRISPRLRKNVIVFVGIILLAIVFAGISLIVPLDGDEGMYAAAGKLVAEGLKPFVDFFITKPPIIYSVTSVVYQLFPSIDNPLASLFLIRFVTVVLHLLSIILLYKFLTFLISTNKGVNSLSIETRREAIITTAIYVCSFNSLYLGSTLKAETIISFLFLAAVYLALRGWFQKRWYFYLVAGAIISTLLLTKYTAVSIIFLFLYICILLKGTWKAKLLPIVTVSIGVVIMTLVFLLLFKLVFNIDLQTLWDFTFNTFVKYDKLPPESLFTKMQAILTFISKEIIVLIALFLSLTVALLSVLKNKWKQLGRDLLSSFYIRLFGGWLIIELILNLVLPKVRYYYLLNILIPLAILSLILIKFSLGWLRQNKVRFRELLTCGFISALTIFGVVMYNNLIPTLDFYAQEGVIVYIQSLFTAQNLYLALLLFVSSIVAILIYKSKLRRLVNSQNTGIALIIFLSLSYLLPVLAHNVYLYAPQYFNNNQDLINISSAIHQLDTTQISSFQGLSGALYVMGGKTLANNRITDITLRFDYSQIDLTILPASFISPEKVFTELKLTDYIVIDPISWRFLYKYQREMYNYLYWNYSVIDQSGYLQIIKKQSLPNNKEQSFSHFKNETSFRLTSEDSSLNPFNSRIYWRGVQLGLKLQYSNVPEGITRFNFDQSKAEITTSEDLVRLAETDIYNDTYSIEVKANNTFTFEVESSQPDSNSQLVIYSRYKSGYFGEGDNLQLYHNNERILDLSKVIKIKEDFNLSELINDEIVAGADYSFYLKSKGNPEGLKITGPITKIRVRKDDEQNTILFDVPPGSAITVEYLPNINFE
jgi:4-amino-4-deoxy-L-arabinose transferase-like glycosyltransferase